jgi:hypothetical protein
VLTILLNSHFQVRFISPIVLKKEHGTAKQNAIPGPILRHMIVINHPQCHFLFVRGFYNFFLLHPEAFVCPGLNQQPTSSVANFPLQVAGVYGLLTHPSIQTFSSN